MSSRQQFISSGKRTQPTPSPKKKQSSQSSPTKKLKVKDDKRSKFFCALEITTRPVVHSFSSPTKFDTPSKHTPMKDVNSPVSVSKMGSPLAVVDVNPKVAKQLDFEDKIEDSPTKQSSSLSDCDENVDPHLFDFLKENSQEKAKESPDELKDSTIFNASMQDSVDSYLLMQKIKTDELNKKLPDPIQDDDSSPEELRKRRYVIVDEDAIEKSPQHQPLSSPSPQKTPSSAYTMTRNKLFPTLPEIQKRIERATRECMSVVRERTINEFERQYTVLSGSAGKTYDVAIRQRPMCSCPDNLSGKSGCHCKHILFVLVQVLGVGLDDISLFGKEILKSDLLKVFYPEKNSDDVKEPVYMEPTIDQRNGPIPGALNDFKPGVHTPKKSPEANEFTPVKTSAQEFLCRDCKKAFCRKGDRDNHEKRVGHERWRKGVALKLNFETTSSD